MAENNITQTLHTILTEGEQYDSISYQNINQLFKALEEIRQFFAETLTNNRSSEVFDTEIAKQYNHIDTNYISYLKTGMKELENSQFIPDDKYSNQVTIPDAFDLIEVGKYYNPYIELLQNMMQECIHFVSNTYNPGDSGECPLNWYFDSKCYEWEEGSNYYGNHCLKYNPASCASHYGECLGYTDDSGAGCTSVCSTQCNDNYMKGASTCPIQNAIDGCSTDCLTNFDQHNGAHFAGGDTLCNGQNLFAIDGGSCNDCGENYSGNWGLCDQCASDCGGACGGHCANQALYGLEG